MASTANLKPPQMYLHKLYQSVSFTNAEIKFDVAIESNPQHILQSLIIDHRESFSN